jgi:hypothetical protein
MRSARAYGRDHTKGPGRMEQARGDKMRRMAFNPRFVNEAGTDLIPGKIHTIRQNYAFWKKFEGKDIELYIWEGKAYQKGSTHKVVCVKRIVIVQPIWFFGHRKKSTPFFYKSEDDFINQDVGSAINTNMLARNDGFENWIQLHNWFFDYPDSEMGIVHFTNFKY